MVSSHSIQGSWRGRYFYPGSSEANGFEAVFIDGDGIVEGNILDDGRLGEASVQGKFFYPHLKFIKIYQSGSMHSVHYQGTMSEDGKTLMGRWSIPGSISGTWTARRYEDGEDLKFEREDERELEFVGEKRHEIAPARSSEG
ncbi:MAG: hypothetical protein IT342_14315 [Candidatus Melainabacteria bacterium]|nr:hypothetical protein [Candidatus Melainabacteria bacterium]